MQPINNSCISVSGCEGQENALPWKLEASQAFLSEPCLYVATLNSTHSYVKLMAQGAALLKWETVLFSDSVLATIVGQFVLLYGFLYLTCKDLGSLSTVYSTALGVLCIFSHLPFHSPALRFLFLKAEGVCFTNNFLQIALKIISYLDYSFV